MTAAGALARGRAAAERLMVDACRITRAGDVGALDPDTGRHAAAGETLVYAGPCRVQVVDSLNDQTPEFGGREVTLQSAVVAIPITATGVDVGDVVKVTAAAHDPELVDTEYRVVATHHKTHATARRLQVEQQTR